MAVIEPHELAKWERGETEPGWLKRTVCKIWHNRLPALLGWHLSPLRIVFGSIRAICFLSLALWPIWIKFFDKTTTVSWGDASWMSAVMVVMLSYCYFYDKAGASPKRRGGKKQMAERLTHEVRGAIAHLAPLLKLARPAADRSEVQIALKRVLGWIRDLVKIHLSDRDVSEIDATLWVFADSQFAQMKVLERTTIGRTSGRAYPSLEIMAFYIAKSGKHRVIHDFRKNHPFPKTGLTTGGPPRYRCVLLIPLLDTAGGGHDTCIGVVSIDSVRPYHFSEGNGDDLVLRLSPYCAWLSFLLGLDCPVHRRPCSP